MNQSIEMLEIEPLTMHVDADGDLAIEMDGPYAMNNAWLHVSEARKLYEWLGRALEVTNV